MIELQDEEMKTLHQDHTMTNPVTFEVNQLSSVIFSHMVQKIVQQW